MKEIISRVKSIQKEYQPIPFWSWNDDLEQDELIRQIQWMKENGIGGFFMHARGGLKTPYLSKEWMECITACSEEAEKLGMDAWIYDENGWPSGFVGGKLLEDESNRDMYIKYQVGPFDENATVVYSVNTEKLIRINSAEDLHDGGNTNQFLNLHICCAASTVDILNPKVVEQFIDLTHEQYKEHFNQGFSKKIMIFNISGGGGAALNFKYIRQFGPIVCGKRRVSNISLSVLAGNAETDVTQLCKKSILLV